MGLWVYFMSYRVKCGPCFCFSLQVLTKDSVTIMVDGVVYYRVFNPTVSITKVEDANLATQMLAQTTLRNMLGTKSLADILRDREEMAEHMEVEYNLNIWQTNYQITNLLVNWKCNVHVTPGSNLTSFGLYSCVLCFSFQAIQNTPDSTCLICWFSCFAPIKTCTTPVLGWWDWTSLAYIQPPDPVHYRFPTLALEPPVLNISAFFQSSTPTPGQERLIERPY